MECDKNSLVRCVSDWREAVKIRIEGSLGEVLDRRAFKEQWWCELEMHRTIKENNEAKFAFLERSRQ